MTAKDWSFPSRRLAASVGGSWLAFTPLRVVWSGVRDHSCGAVAEFHRASRTFRCGQWLWVARPPNCKASRRTKCVTQVVSDRALDVKIMRPCNCQTASRRRLSGHIEADSAQGALLLRRYGSAQRWPASRNANATASSVELACPVVGNTLDEATKRFSTPCTFRSASTTLCAGSSPMRVVPT